AKLSPFATAAKLTAGQLGALHDAMISVLTDAVSRSVGQQAATLKGEKRSGLRVHARTGLPCPVCGDTVREVSFVDKSFQYCPTCQTGGKVLADRRLSRLLKKIRRGGALGPQPKARGRPGDLGCADDSAEDPDHRCVGGPGCGYGPRVRREGP